MKYLNLASRELNSAIRFLEKQKSTLGLKEIIHDLKEQEDKLDTLIINEEDRHGTKRR